MATRRDELNAYSFARRRTVAAFLQPSPHGSEEAAPRPFKTVLPSLGLATLVVIGFGAWGMLSPTAPKGWDEEGKNILVGSESTTRYVLVRTKGEEKPSLHPVLNLASAKLLLKGESPKVMKIKESVLDESKYPMGATVGIPFAPDRLPSSKDAETVKIWALCEAPGKGQDNQPVRATYVLDQSDYDTLLHKGDKELNQHEALYIEAPAAPGGTGPRYMVTADGRAYLMGGKDWKLRSEAALKTLERAVFGDGVTPQKVSAEFIKTLNVVGAVDFPSLGSGVGAPAQVVGLDPSLSKVGLILEAPSGLGKQKYIVLKDRVQPVSDFTAQLWLRSPWVEGVYGGRNPEPVEVTFNDIQPADGEWLSEMNWPKEPVAQANTHWEAGGNKVSCSIWHGKKDQYTGLPQMTVWSGREYPKDVSQSGSSTYVSPGSGLLFKRLTGTSAGGGNVYLVTDTGLRYSVPARNDSQVTGGEKADGQQQTNTAQVRLGYDKIRPVSVPAAWADLLAAGPELSSGNAQQAQGS